ncbi:hypothetical protein Dimus_036138 [Dionaea muscipula]
MRMTGLFIPSTKTITRKPLDLESISSEGDLSDEGRLHRESRMIESAHVASEATTHAVTVDLRLTMRFHLRFWRLGNLLMWKTTIREANGIMLPHEDISDLSPERVMSSIAHELSEPVYTKALIETIPDATAQLNVTDASGSADIEGAPDVNVQHNQNDNTGALDYANPTQERPASSSGTGSHREDTRFGGPYIDK